jgi:hypothetical protein
LICQDFSNILLARRGGVAYHSSVQLYKAPRQMLLGELQQRIAQAQRNKKELLLDPPLFGDGPVRGDGEQLRRPTPQRHA